MAAHFSWANLQPKLVDQGLCHQGLHGADSAENEDAATVLVLAES
jgi:hypothetical protein